MRAAQKKNGARVAWLLLLCLLLSGCTGLLNSRPPGLWYEAYQPLVHPASDAFLASALKEAKAEFGEPAIPVNQVLLRRSRKTEVAKGYRIGEDFSLTECIDPTNGIYVVYIGVDPDHSNYYALLGHECAHLLNPYITDWYMEGVATVFSEQFCEKQGRPWGDWSRHFSQSKRDPYALSYRMMLALQKVCPAEYAQLLDYTRPHGSGKERWQQVDIDRWIASLPVETQQEAVNIIELYAPVLRKHTDRVYSFAVPEVR
jgi:hypothetical protein